MRHVIPYVVMAILFGGGSLLLGQGVIVNATETDQLTPSRTENKCDSGGLEDVLSWGGLRLQDVVATDLDWSKAPEGQPLNAFSSQPVKSANQLLSHVESNAEVGRLIDRALSSAEADRARTPAGWVSVQLKRELSIPANYQLVEGVAVRKSAVAESGEVLWVYVPTDTCKTHRTLVIRSWCGNPVFMSSREV